MQEPIDETVGRRAIEPSYVADSCFHFDNPRTNLNVSATPSDGSVRAERPARRRILRPCYEGYAQRKRKCGERLVG